MAVVHPSSISQVTGRDGNHFQILKVTHTAGTASDIIVDDSAVSACELPDDITVNAGLAKETSTSTGVTIRNQTSGSSGLGFDFQAGDGVKQITIASGATSGTYIIVVRHVGSAAGVLGTNSADL